MKRALVSALVVCLALTACGGQTDPAEVAQQAYRNDRHGLWQ